MNIINGSLKHHLACVQERERKKMTNNVQSAYVCVFFFISFLFILWVCVKCVCLWKIKPRTTNTKMRGKWNKKSHLVYFNYPKRNTSLVRICIGSISFLFFLLVLVLFGMNMRAQNSSKLQNRFLFTWIVCLFLWVNACDCNQYTNQTGNVYFQ